MLGVKDKPEADSVEPTSLFASLGQAEGRMRGPGAGAPGRTSKRQSNETYRDAVRRVMFARYKELD